MLGTTQEIINETVSCLTRQDKWIFIKFSGLVGYDTVSNLEHFDGDASNPLDTGFIFIFSRSVFAGNIME